MRTIDSNRIRMINESAEYFFKLPQAYRTYEPVPTF